MSNLFSERISQALGTVAMFLRGEREYRSDKSDDWREKFDITPPNLQNAGHSPESANSDGWFVTLWEDFDSPDLPAPFVPSPHAKRLTEYWCDQMIRMENSCAVIAARHDEAHVCPICTASTGDFTGGIETRRTEAGNSQLLFAQAFGYFEARVRLPVSGGMWAAFWLQTESVGQIGNGGEDGTEIDIFESSFFNTDRRNVGHALHYDGYALPHHRCMGTVRPCGKDLYDGFHTYAVKWSPQAYVFYVDGIPTWASDFGGVCKVPAFLRLTNEIRPGKIGPYGQRLGSFDGGEFWVDHVRVWQNVKYMPFIKKAEDFRLSSDKKS